MLLKANADINAKDNVSRTLCSKRKEIHSNFLFSIFLFLLFLKMANDFFS